MIADARIDLVLGFVSVDGERSWHPFPCRACSESAAASEMVETAEAAAPYPSRRRWLVSPLPSGRGLETASPCVGVPSGRVLDAETIDNLSPADRATWERFAELAGRLGL